jgi:peptidoglycan/xylan/chitin deacetylase (PgdA/CDA1 family)
MGRRLSAFLGKFERALWPSSPVILMYHRVARTPEDLWGIAIPPERFAEQIEALKQVREVVPLPKLVEGMTSGRSAGKPLAAVTFDDGYHDALAEALPILERLDCPATVYVVSGLVGTGKSFWWDELVHMLLAAPAGRGELRIEINGKADAWTVPDDPAGRRRIIRKVRRRLRDLDPAEIDRQLDAIAAWAGEPRRLYPDDRLMTPEEVGRLDQGVVTVGAHTVRHPSLPELGFEAQLAEIAQSRAACEAWVGRQVDEFAYPFGHHDEASVRAAREAGFASACATIPSVVRPWTDPFRLPRITTGQMDGEALARRLS